MRLHTCLTKPVMGETLDWSDNWKWRVCWCAWLSWVIVRHHKDTLLVLSANITIIFYRKVVASPTGDIRASKCLLQLEYIFWDAPSIRSQGFLCPYSQLFEGIQETWACVKVVEEYKVSLKRKGLDKAHHYIICQSFVWNWHPTLTTTVQIEVCGWICNGPVFETPLRLLRNQICVNGTCSTTCSSTLALTSSSQFVSMSSMPATILASIIAFMTITIEKTDSPESAQVSADSTTGWRGVSWTSWSYAAACLCQCWRQNSPIIVEIFTRWNIFVYSRSMSILSSSESNRAMPTQWTSPQHFLHLHSYPVRLKRLVPASCFSVLITTVLLPPCLLLAELSQSSLYGSDTHTG